MNIAFFMDSYKPYISGVTNSAEILATNLRRLGHRVYIFAPSYPGHIDTDPDITRFPSIAGGYPNFRLAIPFVRNMPEVDIIHSHSPFQAGLLARLIARKNNIPLAYSFHTFFTRYTHYARFVPKAAAKLGITAYIRQYANGVDTVIAPSEMARRYLKSLGVKKQIEIIPSGVEIDKLPASLPEARATLRSQHHIPHDAIVLVYAGRVSKEKNIPFLFKAFEHIKDENVYLAIVGNGPLDAELHRQHRRNKRVIFITNVSYPGILAYYSIGDIFLFSSTTETQGMVIAEAKASGLPVVALFAGALTGSVRSGVDGYLVPRSLPRFAEHVRRLIADPVLRRKMSVAGLEDALDRFAAPAVAKSIETLYNSLIDHSSNS
ncbi:MAG: glycosyltransferase [Candidatus Margulisbacteria bacterium]|nr:glycosyltransferase [Candidatus Margulisiibacteriota bacterium]